MQNINRRTYLTYASATMAGWLASNRTTLAEKNATKQIKITGVKITPIALPDPPILAAGGCHGPYFLRNVIELETDSGITGIGETHGGQSNTKALQECKPWMLGKSPFAYRSFFQAPNSIGSSIYAGIELACLDAIGKVTGRRLCELLGGPVREQVEFASYLFYRYASDHPLVLNDGRLVDDRGRGDNALDPWGEVRSPESMAELAWQFHKKWGFRVHKLKAGVFPPDLELKTLQLINDRFDGKHQLRIDPNGRWLVETANRIGQHLKRLPLEYYEDPVAGQQAMAEVRQNTNLPMSTNSCVTRFDHIPNAVRTQPIDVVLGDHHGWGGVTAFQTLGAICKSLGWTLSQHSNNHGGITMAAMIHVGAITPQLTHASDTHYVWLPQGTDIIEGDNLPISDGKMSLPAGPGVGVTIDQDKLAKAHETYIKSRMKRRNDAATMRRFIPGWKRELF